METENTPTAAAPPPVARTTSSGIEPNVAGGLAYVLGLVTGIVFLLIEKENRFVRFHAYQSIFYSVAWGVLSYIVLPVLSLILGNVPVVGMLIGIIASIFIPLAGFIIWVFLLVNAFQGKQWKLPYLGDYAERYAASS